MANEMNRMARQQFFRNYENGDYAAAFRRLAAVHRQNARDANPRGNALDRIAAVAAGIREARCERVTVNDSVLRYSTFLTSDLLTVADTM